MTAGNPPLIRAAIINFFLFFVKTSVLTSRPAMNIRNTAPKEPKNSIGGVRLTMLKPIGPTNMPAAIRAIT